MATFAGAPGFTNPHLADDGSFTTHSHGSLVQSLKGPTRKGTDQQDRNLVRIPQCARGSDRDAFEHQFGGHHRSRRHGINVLFAERWDEFQGVVLCGLRIGIPEDSQPRSRMNPRASLWEIRYSRLRNS
jgi:hypothetical protein